MANIVVNNVKEVNEALGQIATYNQQMYNEMLKISEVCTKFSSAWISDANDYESTINSLKTLQNEFETNIEPLKIQAEKAKKYLNIEPVITQFIDTMNTYIIETVKTAGGSI